jgi:hypothetical protein
MRHVFLEGRLFQEVAAKEESGRWKQPPRQGEGECTVIEVLLLELQIR